MAWQELALSTRSSLCIPKSLQPLPWLQISVLWLISEETVVPMASALGLPWPSPANPRKPCPPPCPLGPARGGATKQGRKRDSASTPRAIGAASGETVNGQQVDLCVLGGLSHSSHQVQSSAGPHFVSARALWGCSRIDNINDLALPAGEQPSIVRFGFQK